MILDKCIPRFPKDHPKANLNDAQVASLGQYAHGVLLDASPYLA